MPTSYPLHPIAAARLEALADEAERKFGKTDSERKIVNALVYGATAAQLQGMLEEFAKDRRTYNDLHADDPEGEAERQYAGK
jgi:hypothetical protein